MKVKNIIKVLTVSVIGVSLFTACGNSRSSTKTVSGSNGEKLQVIRVANMTGQPDQYADYIGTEQGIFEKYGIALETSEYAAGINTVDAIATGTADTGLLADFALVNRFGNTLDNTNLVIYSDLSSSVSYNGGLYVAPKYKDNLDALDGSEGWITTVGTVYDYFNWQAQTYLKLDPAKQKSVNTDSITTQIAVAHNGEASAAVVTGSAIKKYEEEGWVQVASAKDIGIAVSSYLITTNDFAKNNSELLANYLKALDESSKYITENLDESASKISEKFGIEPDDFKTNWEQYDVKLGLSESAAEHLDSLNSWAYDNGKYLTEYDIRKFYSADAAKKAFPDNTDVKLSENK